MYKIEGCGFTHKSTEVGDIPYDKAFTLEEYSGYIYVRTKPLNDNRIHIVLFDTSGQSVLLFDHSPSVVYEDVTLHDFSIKLLS